MAYVCDQKLGGCGLAFMGASQWPQKGYCPKCMAHGTIHATNAPFGVTRDFVPPPVSVPPPNPNAPARPETAPPQA